MDGGGQIYPFIHDNSSNVCMYTAVLEEWGKNYLRRMKYILKTLVMLYFCILRLDLWNLLKLFQNGYTPLHIAAKKNQMDIATTLLEYGARPDAESKVWKLTHYSEFVFSQIRETYRNIRNKFLIFALLPQHVEKQYKISSSIVTSEKREHHVLLTCLVPYSKVVSVSP